MQQFKTLLKKEFWTHKTATLLPGFIIFGIYVCIIIALIIAFVKNPDLQNGVYIGNGEMSLGEMREVEFDNTKVASWILGFVTPFFAMVVAIWSILGITNGALNDDYKNRCILFHKSLPVPFIKQTSAKLVYVLMLIAGYCLSFSIVSMIINSILLAKSFHFGLFLVYGLVGSIQGSIYCCLQGFMLVSLTWFFSAIFISKAFIKTITSIAAIYLGLFIIGKIFAVSSVINGFFLKLLDIFFAVNTIELIYGNDAPIMETFASIFNFDILIRLFVGCSLLVAGYFILNKREID